MVSRVMIAALLLICNINLTAALDSTLAETETKVETKLISFGFDNEILSRYIDRGISYNRGVISQSYAWISLEEFTLSVWGNIVASDFDSNIKSHEVDFSLIWSKPINDFYIEPSVYYCVFPNQPDSPPTIESNLLFMYSPGVVSIYSNLRVDILEYSGCVSGDIGLSSSINLSEQFELSADLNSGWTNEKFNLINYGISEPGRQFQYLSLGFDLNYVLSDYVSIVPRFEFCKPVTEMLRSISGSGLSNFAVRVEIAY